MALYPDVQRKAQAEIDAVVGPNRLPDFEDRLLLPYINAVVKELMRWHLVVPLGEVFSSSRFISCSLFPKPCLICLLMTMNMMVTIFQKEQLYLAIHGEYK